MKDAPKSGSPKTSRSDKMIVRALKHDARLSLKIRHTPIKTVISLSSVHKKKGPRTVPIQNTNHAKLFNNCITYQIERLIFVVWILTLWRLTHMLFKMFGLGIRSHIFIVRTRMQTKYESLGK